MTSHHDHLSARDYEREAEHTRHRLAHGLNELSDRLTPGQVFDEMLTYAKGGSGTFLRVLANASRDNPIPTLLIGAGLMMFLSEKIGLNRYISRNDGAETPTASGMAAAAAMSHAAARFAGAASRASDAAASTASHVGGAASGAASRATDAAASGVRSAADAATSGVRRTSDFAAEQAAHVAAGAKQGAVAVGDTFSETAQRAKMTAHDLRDQASSTADQIRHRVESVAGTVQDYSSSFGEQVAETAQHSRRQTVRAARRTKNAAVSFINEQPLVCAAIGLAVGAAIAAMLPSTETEDQFMGEASDAVKSAVGEVASEQYQSAKDAAGKVVQEAKSLAEREGLTLSGAADMARGIGEKLKHVAAETSAAASSEAHDLAENAKNEARGFARTKEQS